MKSFLEIAKPVIDSGIYMSAHFSDDSCKVIRSIQEKLNVKEPVSADKLHATVVYSRKTVDLFPEDDLSEPAQIVDIDVWDTKYGRTLIGKLKSDYLQSRFKEAQDAGATYDYDSYIPHVTLSYDSGLKDSPDLIKKRLQFPYDLTIVSERTESLDLDKKIEDLTEHIVHRGEKWILLSKDRSKELGSYDTKEEAETRMGQIEYFKNKG